MIYQKSLIVNENRFAEIDNVNTSVDICDVLTNIKVYVPETIKHGGNKKIHCPFGFYHSDGGRSKAMRVYRANNTAYCFSCSKRYSPVSLAAAYWDCSWATAAHRLSEEAGFKPKTLKERWAEATTPEEKKVDLIALADALKMFCQGYSIDWETKQYDDTVATKLNKCLKLLDVIDSDEQAIKWLDVCKKVMMQVLEVP